MKTLKFTPCILVYISIYILEVKLQNLLNDVYMYRRKYVETKILKTHF